MITKEYVVLRYILERAIEKNNITFTERAIARELNLSQKTVYSAIDKVKEFGGIGTSKNKTVGCGIMDYEKLLDYLGLRRNLREDVIYETFLDTDVGNIEKMAVENGGILTAYSAYTNKFGNDIADYLVVYFYALPENMNTIKQVFPQNTFTKFPEYKNVIVLKPDFFLANQIRAGKVKESVSLVQMYIDLYQLKDWQSYRFRENILKKIGEIYDGARAVL